MKLTTEWKTSVNITASVTSRELEEVISITITTSVISIWISCIVCIIVGCCSSSIILIINIWIILILICCKAKTLEIRSKVTKIKPWHEVRILIKILAIRIWIVIITRRIIIVCSCIIRTWTTWIYSIVTSIIDFI